MCKFLQQTKRCISLILIFVFVFASSVFAAVEKDFNLQSSSLSIMGYYTLIFKNSDTSQSVKEIYVNGKKLKEVKNKPTNNNEFFIEKNNMWEPNIYVKVDLKKGEKIKLNTEKFSYVYTLKDSSSFSNAFDPQPEKKNLVSSQETNHDTDEDNSNTKEFTIVGHKSTDFNPPSSYYLVFNSLDKLKDVAKVFINDIELTSANKWTIFNYSNAFFKDSDKLWLKPEVANGDVITFKNSQDKIIGKFIKKMVYTKTNSKLNLIKKNNSMLG